MANHDDDKPTAMTRVWGLSVGSRVWIGGHNAAAKRMIQAHLAGMARPPTGPIDAGFIAPASADEAIYFADKLRPRLRPGGAVWIVYPATCSTDHAEFDGTRQDLITGLSELGFSESCPAKPTDDYTSLSFRLPSGPDQ